MKIVKSEGQQPVDAILIRQEDIAAIKESMERGLEKGFKYFGWNSEDGILRNDSVYCIQTKEIAEDFCWNPDLKSMPAMAVRLLPAYNALVKELRGLAGGGEIGIIFRLDLEGIEKIDPAKSRRQYNYDDLKNTLMNIGTWNEDISELLIRQMIKGDDSFKIDLSARANGEPMNVRLHFNGGSHQFYSLNHLDISGIKIPHIDIKGTKTLAIEEQLKSLDTTQKINSPDKFRKLANVLKMVNVLEGVPEGKPIADKLLAKYFSHALEIPDEAKAAMVQSHTSTQSFAVKPDFPLTVDQAFNLFSGRSVNLKIPGKDVNEKAWFKLDPIQRDHAGNALLLQYHAHYNFNPATIFEDLSLKTKSGDNPEKLISAFFNGDPINAIIALNGREIEARVTADPLSHSATISRKDGQSMSPELLAVFVQRNDQISSPPLYPYVFAYDGQLNRQAFTPDLSRQASTELTRKEAIIRSLNSPDTPAGGQTRKR